MKILGPSWQRTPVRRSIQTLSLLIFLVFFLYLSWPYRHDYTSIENTDELVPVELFLILDPLVSISTAIASRAFIWSLVAAAIVLMTGVFLPRWFCCYVCPLGTIIDLFDWGIGKRIRRFRLKKRGWWVKLRFYLLTLIIISAAFGVLISGFFAAIPVVTRGMMYIFAPLQLGLMNSWEAVPQISPVKYISISIFLIVLGLGLLHPRFWCAYVCPSGALLSLASLLRVTERKVENSCIACGKCITACSFNAIAPDFSTRSIECTFCRECEDVCPKKSIKFVSRWNKINIKPLCNEDALLVSSSRRRFLFGLFGAAGAGAVAATALASERSRFSEIYPVRPPGSVPEEQFRRQCIRCGQCLKTCPGNVLQPAGLELGLDGIWTPKITADFSGCKPYCNNCGQVCPTGAIRELTIEEKRSARIGLAEVDTTTCLPHILQENCGLCLEQCLSAGYNAIEYIRVGIEYDDQGMMIPASGFLAPAVQPDKCIGCGLCQAECFAVNVKKLKLLNKSAIVVKAGPNKEDRLASGSYIELQQQRKQIQEQNQTPIENTDYLPDFLL